MMPLYWVIACSRVAHRLRPEPMDRPGLMCPQAVCSKTVRPCPVLLLRGILLGTCVHHVSIISPPTCCIDVLLSSRFRSCLLTLASGDHLQFVDES